MSIERSREEEIEIEETAIKNSIVITSAAIESLERVQKKLKNPNKLKSKEDKGKEEVRDR